MNRLSGARVCCGPLRLTALTAVLMSGAALLLAGIAGCSGSGVSGSPGSSVNGSAPRAAAPAPDNPAAANGPAAGSAATVPGRAGPAAAGSGSGSGPSARLAGSAASVIHTASLTVHVRSVTTAASAATRIAMSSGGYVSGENASINPGGDARPAISLQLKIPVAAYPAALDELSTGLGTETSLTQQAQDVTEQVADTSSRVTSARAAITQLRTLLARTGSVSDLLTVQDQINSEESSLEQLEADQRALDDQTSLATVSLSLLGPRPEAAARGTGQHHQRRGFLAGLSAGWRALRATVSAVLTALGAVLPFAAAAAILVACGITARRRLARLLRRRSRPSAAG